MQNKLLSSVNSLNIQGILKKKLYDLGENA